MTRKQLYITVAAIIALSAAIAWRGGWFSPQERGGVTVGVLVPLTGAAASYGQNSRRGAELALKDFSATNPGVKVELRVEDSRGEAAVGVSAAQKLVDVDRVVAVMGDVTSGVTLAVAPLMNQRKVALVSPGASAPKVRDAGDFIFRTWPSDTIEAAAMATHVKSAKISALAFLRVNNEYGIAMETAVRAHLGPEFKVVAAETFEQGARDFRTQLLKIKEAKADGLYFIGFPEAAVVLGSGYATVGLSIPVFATSAFEDKQIPEKTGGVLNGTVFGKPISESAATGAFRDRYRQAFNADASVTSDTAYDATMLLLRAIASIASASQPVTGEAIRDQLLKVRDYPGVSGMLTFDEKGDVVKPVGLFTLREGRYIELSK